MTTNYEELAAATRAMMDGADEAVARVPAITGSGGDSSTAQATCTADGSVQDLTISLGFIGKVDNAQLESAIQDAIRAAQAEAVRLRDEAVSGLPTTVEQLGQRITEATREMTERLAEIQARMERITREGA